MQKPFDPKKPLRTRSGRKVEIYRFDVPGQIPIQGRVIGFDGPFGWRENGMILGCDERKTEWDLINVPDEVEVKVFWMCDGTFRFRVGDEEPPPPKDIVKAWQKVLMVEGEGL